MRIALSIEYNGANYFGWQKQKIHKTKTIQYYVDNAISEIANEYIRNYFPEIKSQKCASSAFLWFDFLNFTHEYIRDCPWIYPRFHEYIRDFMKNDFFHESAPNPTSRPLNTPKFREISIRIQWKTANKNWNRLK